MPAVAALLVQLVYVTLWLIVQLVVAVLRAVVLLVVHKRRKSQAKATNEEAHHDRS